MQMIKTAFGIMLIMFVTSCALPPALDGDSMPQTPDLFQGVLSDVYFVSVNDGSDANPGTKDMPWKTIQKATDVISAGDTVRVSEGIYPERVKIYTSGREDQRITFQADGRVITKGFTVEADYISINGFEITDTSDEYVDGVGIFVKGSACVLENNYIHDAVRGGILLFATSGNYQLTSNCVVRGNRLYRNSQKGIDVRGRNHLIEQNEIWGTIQYHPGWINPPDSVDADGIRFFGSGHIFRGNYIHDITYRDPENISAHIDCFQTWNSTDFEGGNNTLFEKNICINMENKGGEEVGKGFMLEDARNISIRNNLVRAYFGVFTIAASEIVIANNTFAYDFKLTGADDYPTAIRLIDTRNSKILNNVFYDFNGLNISWEPFDVLSQPEISGNLFFRSDAKPLLDAAFQGNYFGIDPGFLNPDQNDFHFYGDSPLVDSGIQAADIAEDLDGIKRPQGGGYDIGAYELQFP